MHSTSGFDMQAVSQSDEARRVAAAEAPNEHANGAGENRAALDGAAHHPGDAAATLTFRRPSPADIGEAKQAFRDAAAARGLVLPLKLVSGKLQRCGTDDHENGTDGTYLFYEDGLPAGGFQNHKDGQGWEKWHAKPRNGHQLTKAEWRQIAERHRKAAEQAERDKVAREKEAARRAGKVWGELAPASGDHPYLTAKGIKASGARQVPVSDLVETLGYTPKAGGHDLTGRVLIIPMRDVDNALWSLQFIDGEGRKANLAGGRKQGCFAVIDTIDPRGRLLVGEGHATMASCHEATGLPAVIAFDCGNLGPVAKALRAKYPDLGMTFCADHDAWTKGNPGETKARDVVASVGGWLAVPQFSALRADGETDFNDLHRREGLEAVRRCIEAAKPCFSEKRPVLVSRRASDIMPEPIAWFWPGRIARGKVTLIAGMPGLGKSQITAYLAATVSIGGTLPADGGKSPLGSVIFLSAEDDPADTIVPRLMAAGADRRRIEIVEAVSEPVAGQPGIRRPVCLKSDLTLLSDVTARLGDTVLVIVDPLSAYLGRVDSHKNAEVRVLLALLTDWAGQRQVAVVGVTHLNKGGGDALSRFTGSMAFVAAARAGFLVVPDAEDETGGRRLFLPAKNNIAKKLPGLAFTVQGVTLANEIETSRIEWCPGEVNVSADEALYGANGEDEDKSSVKREVDEFLNDLLRDGEKSA
jgi:putative DNA primase/helicase